MKKTLNIRGETLAETIIALSILAMGITISSTVIMNSLRNLSNAKNRIVAVNLAREGIEAVRGIRDTNWLLYSDKRRQCWNHDPGMGICSGDGTNLIVPETYIVYKFTDGSWRLQLMVDTDLTTDSILDADLIVDNDMDLAPLSLVDIDIDIDSDNADGDDDPSTGKNDDLDMYNHMDAVVDQPFGKETKTTRFSRYIVIEYLENKPANVSPSNATAPLDSINTSAEWAAASQDLINRMRVTSVVGWLNRGVHYTVELKTIITDHLGREDLTS